MKIKYTITETKEEYPIDWGLDENTPPRRLFENHQSIYRRRSYASTR